MKTIGWAVATLVIAGMSATVVYQGWTRDERSRIAEGSDLVATERGPIEYAVRGQAGPVILIAHGSPGGYDFGAAVGTLLDPQGYRVLAISRPGYLRTRLQVGVTPEEQGSAYAALLDALGIDSVAVMGISAGGLSSLQFALRHPRRCWAVVLISAVTERKSPGRQTYDSILGRGLNAALSNDVVFQLPILLAQRSPTAATALLRLWDPSLAARVGDDPDSLAIYRNFIDAMSMRTLRRPGLENDMLQMARAPEFPLEEIEAPTLIVHGTNDAHIPFEHAQRTAERISNARLVAIHGGDHFGSITRLDEVVPDVLSFLDLSRPTRQSDQRAAQQGHEADVE